MRGQPPRFRRWWLWAVVVLLLVSGLFLLGPMTHKAGGHDDGILRQLFQRIGSGGGSKPE